ncbi:MAG: hypothetical protein HN790_02295 [Methylococcales bacterium]|jgi:protein-tyrosine phosphatase|nr:hypothetical protein [Methylococcales bacterium]
MVDDIFKRFENGQGVAVHCRAGIGRSGMTTIAVLVRYGLSVDDAITLVSQARGIPVPDTEEQIDWLYDHSGQPDCLYFLLPRHLTIKMPPQEVATW